MRQQPIQQQQGQQQGQQRSLKEQLPLRSKVRSAIRWTCASVLVGAGAGACSVALSAAAIWAEGVHGSSWWTFALLPALALAVEALYRALSLPSAMGTVSVIDRCRHGEYPSWKIAPAIFLGTASTLVGGGSVGKEAAALQMGAGIASAMRGLVGKDASSVRIFGLCGMAAAFSALMYAPLAAAAFVLEAVRIPRESWRDPRLLCVIVSSATGYGVARLFGIGRLWGAPLKSWDGSGVMEAMVVCVICAFAGFSFVLMLKLARTACSTFIRSPWLRALAGSALVVAVCLVFPASQVACGTGDVLIRSALAGSGVGAWDFAWKFGLTIAALAFGLKGGEIMPVLCIGACLGSVLATVTGSSQALLAAVGMVAMFSSCTNCPVASFLLGIEMSGLSAWPLMALAALVGLVSGRNMSLYKGADWQLDVYWSKK